MDVLIIICSYYISDMVLDFVMIYIKIGFYRLVLSVWDFRVSMMLC